MSDDRQRADSLPSAARRVAEALAAADHPTEVRLLDEHAHSADAAAAALGVTPRQIVKSMVFRGKAKDRLVLVLLPGDLRVDMAMAAAALGEVVERADPDWVRERTGYSIGGIPPLGHATAPAVVVDRRLLDQDVLWAGAGTPRALFRTGGRELAAMVGGVLADVGRLPPTAAA
ncbi:MAG: YbaK/EbsC family protein [Solirubrobacterales bacterium]